MSKTSQPVEPVRLPNNQSALEGSATSPPKSFLRSFLGSVLVIAGVSASLAVPFTKFQRLDIEYRAKHADELRVTTKRYTNPQSQITTEHYEYRPTPWAIPAKVSVALFLLIPPITTIFASVRHCRRITGTVGRRLFEATLLSTTFIPVACLCWLPWAQYYWVGWEWAAGWILLLAYALFTCVVSFAANCVAIHH
jgi:hypothetical protein